MPGQPPDGSTGGLDVRRRTFSLLPRDDADVDAMLACEEERWSWRGGEWRPTCP